MRPANGMVQVRNEALGCVYLALVRGEYLREVED